MEVLVLLLSKHLGVGVGVGGAATIGDGVRIGVSSSSLPYCRCADLRGVDLLALGCLEVGERIVAVFSILHLGLLLALLVLHTLEELFIKGGVHTEDVGLTSIPAGLR